MQILKGHTSEATAYVVEDYPYGFNLRCKMRLWIEFRKGHGVRLVTQTSNPKRGHVWNKPKTGTYSKFGGCLFLDENGHCHMAGLTEYSDLAEIDKWIATYGEGNTIPDVTAQWRKAKQIYEEKLRDKIFPELKGE